MKPHLWRVMEEADGDESRLRSLAESGTAEQLILLNRRFGITAATLRELPAFRAHAAPGHADSLARWVVTQGKRTWLAAQRDPSTLPRESPDDTLDVAGVLADVYDARFGGRIPDQEPDPDASAELGPAPEWEERGWQVIDVARAGIPLAEAVSGFTRSELIRLYASLEALVEGPVSERLHEARGEDPAGFGWVHIAQWIVSQGRDEYERLLANPQDAPAQLPEGAFMILSELDDAYMDRYGDPMPAWSARGADSPS